MVGELSILKEKQNKTKTKQNKTKQNKTKQNKTKQNKTKTKQQENLTHLWDLKKKKIITHLRSWNKQATAVTNKQNNSPPKTRPNSHAPWNQNNDVRLSWRVGIMIYTFFFSSNNIVAKLLSYLCWHGNKSNNKRKMLTVLSCFF